MAVPHYLDFDLLIEPDAGGWRAHVLGSPAGQALAHVTALPPAPSAASSTDAVTVGSALWTAIFSGELLSCLLRSMDEARHQAAGLRIRLRLADDPRLANLPWEYLYDPVRQQFLCLSTSTPIMRYLELPEPVRPLDISPPLRLLVLLAGPRDYPPLDGEHEWQQINTALAGPVERKLLTIERLDGGDLGALQERLRQQNYHILHFIGHGGFAEDRQEGVIVVGDSREEGRAVSGRLLGTLLHDHQSLRLLVLNACRGAQTSATSAFAGVAQRCIQQGLPAVIAMQSAIGDRGAVTFSETLYTTLGAGYPLDAALAEARKAIYVGDNDLDWAIPVLYMRAPDGHLWHMQQGATMQEDATHRPEEPWWNHVPAHVAGDMIIANVGAGASGVAIGKQITQTLGAPQPGDRQMIEQQLAQVTTALQGCMQAGLDPSIAMMAKFQLQLLGGELIKLGKDEVPSASTVTQVGGWLLDNVPQIAGALTGLFATPAVGKVVAKAGDLAVAWARQRFGSAGGST